MMENCGHWCQVSSLIHLLFHEKYAEKYLGGRNRFIVYGDKECSECDTRTGTRLFFANAENDKKCFNWPYLLLNGLYYKPNCI